MHDPDVLLFDVPFVGLDIGHREPHGHDAFEVCGRPPNRGRLLSRAVWMVRHVRHLHLRWWPSFKVRCWIVDRCDHCGQRFRWRDSRHSYQSTDRVWHEICMSLRHVRSDLDDLTGYVLGTADSDAKWRVRYRLESIGGEASDG